MAETLPTEAADNPEQQIIDQESLRAFWEDLREHLSGMERTVLDEYLAGLNYRQIAEKMGKSPKSIDNALSRIRAKVFRPG